VSFDLVSGADPGHIGLSIVRHREVGWLHEDRGWADGGGYLYVGGVTSLLYICWGRNRKRESESGAES